MRPPGASSASEGHAASVVVKVTYPLTVSNFLKDSSLKKFSDFDATVISSKLFQVLIITLSVKGDVSSR